ncbi:MAG: pyrroline-5-carboxylate reductase [Lachnospiraceae bacterium]|nr:pyrroline-5-carboxylate reductase [Lachnospiraceae bacterium]
MKKFKIGFIGMGNMAKAIADGLIKAGSVEASNILAFAPHYEKLEANAREIGFTPYKDANALCKDADMVVVACKPYQIEGVLKTVKTDLKGKALISVAAGWSYNRFKEILKDDVRIQCIMPNTPAMVAKGVFLFEEENSLTEEEGTYLENIFESIGLVESLPSRLMEIGAAITGCGPAFVDLFMEAYADAAVKYGIQRPLAYKLVGHMVAGSAALMLESGKHPGQLKDEVCSPGGTTIRGVEALEADGLRTACIDSVNAVMNK